MSEIRRGTAMALTSEHCQRAQANLLSAIDGKSRLPKNVFRPGWGTFYLFNSDWMFEGAFVEKVRMLLKHEGASCACIINLDRDIGVAPYSFAIDDSTAAQDYQRRLVGVGPGDGWVYDMDRFGCTSDIGMWCIYCERASELAIIGFRAEALQERHEFVLATLHASRISSVGASPSRFEFSSHSMSTEWQAEIMRNYESA
jgi:hypothetical protein